MEKIKYLLKNLKCDCHTTGHKINSCDRCNLKILDNILCFKNIQKKDLTINNTLQKTKYSSWKRYNFEKVNLALKEKENLKILDIGSGRHFIENIYPNLGANTFFRLDIAPRNYVDIIADFQKDNYFKSCFDVVICLNVMEHVYSFDKFFKNLTKVVKKDGIILLSVPYNSGLHYLPHDYFRMSHYALKKMFNDNQCQIKQLEPFYQNVSNKLFRLIDNFFINNNLISKFIRIIIIFLIKIQNKIHDLQLENKLIDDVNTKHKKLYSEPVGYFVIAKKL